MAKIKMIAKFQTQTQVKKSITENNSYLMKFIDSLKGRIDMLERQVRDLQKAKCIICGKQLLSNNNSGYCNNCYIHSPDYLIYQRNVQRQLSHDPKNKLRVRKYQKKNKTKISNYQKKYQKLNQVRLREIKNKWASKNRYKIKKSREKRK